MDLQRKTKFGFLAALGLIAALAIFVPSHQAHASSWLFGLDEIAAGAVGYIAYVVIYIVSTLVGVLIAIITYFIAVILQLSGNIVNTLAVQSGFAVTLAVANLGFVLGIIVIAIATILRRETYGIKKTLWKLVVAAILVNFSLVIGGVFINFSNTLTSTFLTALPGGGSKDALDFSTQLAGAFSPQRSLLFFNASDTTISSHIGNGPIQNANAGSTIASIVTPIISVTCAVALLIVIVVTLIVFCIMLLIRYVTLSILLVIMPFAWLMWLFPKTSHMWTKWWNEFIRWTFFAPIVIFFLWLAMATAQAMNNNTTNNPLAFLKGTQYTATSNSILSGVSSSFGSAIGAFAGTALQGIIVIGLAIGGMYAANKLSIMGAKETIGAFKGGGKAAGAWAAKRGARGTLNTAARIMQPRTRTAPGGGIYTPLTPTNRLRGQWAQSLRGAANNQSLASKGLGASVWGGMKKGSGIFKGKVAQSWECQVCHNIVQNTQKPTIPCRNCGALAGAANWTKVNP